MISGSKNEKRVIHFIFFCSGVISFVTHEVVTFVMLGAILISLTNINSSLKEVIRLNKNKVN